MEKKRSGHSTKESYADALRQSEEVFRQLAGNIRETLFVMMPDCRIAYISPAYEEIFGRSPDELFIRADAWIDAVHPEDREHVRGVLNESVQGRATAMEYRIVANDGSVHWIHARSFPIKDSQDKLCRIVGMAEDVTERKKFLENAQAARSAAEAGSRAKSEFLAKTHHEMLTLMNGIIGMTDLLLDTRLTAEQGEYLQMVKASADSLLTIINHLIDS